MRMECVDKTIGKVTSSAPMFHSIQFIVIMWWRELPGM